MTQTARFTKGDNVALKSSPDRQGMVVDGPRGKAEDQWQVLFLDNAERRWFPESQLEHLVIEEVTFVGHRRFLRDIAYLKLTHSYSDVLYSMAASRTKFLVYQFQPVIKFIQSLPHGVLIADEVGLGKTIEAGLILKELIARGSVRRVLVVCPANLKEKWRSEMQQRFSLPFRVITAEDVRNIRRDVQEIGWPDFFGIASLEGLRRDDLRAALQETGIQFDLVIIDEAHHLRNPATQSFELGEILSDQADHVLLLSATPVQTGDQDLLSLLRLIEPAEFEITSSDRLRELLEPNEHINAALAELSKPKPDAGAAARLLRGVLQTSMSNAFDNNPLFLTCLGRLADGVDLAPDTIADLRRDIQNLHTLARYFTRTRKREVEDVANRRPHVIHVPLSAEELRFYETWVVYNRALAQVKAPGAPTAWAVSMRERQAASSLHAAREALDNLLDLPGDIQSTDPDEDEEFHFGRIDSKTGRYTQPSPNRVLLVSRDLVEDAAEAMGERDTKVEALINAINGMLNEKPSRKILVFTFFKGTLRHLSNRLGRARIGCSSMSGDDPPERRADIAVSFRRDPSQNVLLATEVAAEGLDFQFCDTVINFDLPWNPMRVEQRIGRIDRFGQTEPVVHVLSLFVDETIDTRILERLYDRIGVFERSIGELEPILGPVVRQLEQEVFSNRLTHAEEERKANDALVRVETLKQKTMELEESRAELLGQGDLIREEIRSARSSGRYITAPELHALIHEWLDSSGLGKDAIRPTDRDGVWELRLSDRSIGRVNECLTKERRFDPQVNKMVHRIHERGFALCTFDPEIAQQFGEIAFLDVSHPVVTVALESAKQDPPRDPMTRVCRLRLNEPLGASGDIALFLYRLSVGGAEPRSSLLPVAVDLDGEFVREDVGDVALGFVTAGSQDGSDLAIDFGQIRALEAIAFEHASDRRLRTEQWCSETQQARLSTRRATIERSYEVRIHRKRELNAQATDSRIRRLYEGEARNLEAALESRLAAIDATPEPYATLDLIAVALMSE